MIIWNLISFLVLFAALYQAENNGWKRPKLVSWATIAVLWFGGSFALYLVS